MNIEELQKVLSTDDQAAPNNTAIFAYILDEMYNLYVKKNSCYGDSFSDTWTKLGPISGVTRLYDKLNRVANLVKGGKNDFESIEDTFIDLANYSVMCLVEMQKEKLKEQTSNIKAISATNSTYSKKSKKTNKTILNEGK